MYDVVKVYAKQELNVESNIRGGEAVPDSGMMLLSDLDVIKLWVNKMAKHDVLTFFVYLNASSTHHVIYVKQI